MVIVAIILVVNSGVFMYHHRLRMLRITMHDSAPSQKHSPSNGVCNIRLVLSLDTCKTAIWPTTPSEKYIHPKYESSFHQKLHGSTVEKEKNHKTWETKV